MLEIAFRADPRSDEPVYRQLAACLRAWIEAGRLRVGEQLPPTRDLARALGLARNTVLQAYLTLIDAGLAYSHVGQGTFVAARTATGPATPTARPAPSFAPRAFAWDGLFAIRGRDLPPSGLLRRLRDDRRWAVDFRGGHVDAGSLPTAALARACTRALRRDAAAMAAHRDPRGWPALREQVAHRLVARGIACGPDDVLIVAGAQQALDLIGRVLLDPGDTVAMEQPGYFGATLAFRACGAHLVGVPVDGDGLRTTDLARLLRARRVKLLYTTPAVQSPSGVALADARRHALLELADAHQLPVVEDDYDSELRLGAPTPPALKTHDAAGQVIYVATFSKALFPGMRIGYVVAARPVLERLAIAHFATEFQTSPLLQAALVELLAAGDLDRHVRRVRRTYAERLTALRTALAESMPDGTTIGTPAGGNTLWVGLPPGVDADGVFAAAREQDVVYDRGDACFLAPPPREWISLCVANVERRTITDGAQRLGRIVRAHLPAATRRRAG